MKLLDSVDRNEYFPDKYRVKIIVLIVSDHFDDAITKTTCFSIHKANRISDGSFTLHKLLIPRNLLIFGANQVNPKCLTIFVEL